MVLTIHYIESNTFLGPISNFIILTFFCSICKIKTCTNLLKKTCFSVPNLLAMSLKIRRVMATTKQTLRKYRVHNLICGRAYVVFHVNHELCQRTLPELCVHLVIPQLKINSRLCTSE